MIPKKIHYCWFGGNPLPKDVVKCIRSWEKFCPEYEIIQWDERNFDVNCHKFAKDAYVAKAWAFVSDYARLKIIFENGGIYFDTDVELLKNLDFLLNNSCYVGIQQGERLCNTGIGFGAEKGAPVIKKMLMVYDKVAFDINKKAEIQCPRLNDSVIKAIGYQYVDDPVFVSDTLILPCRYMDPLSTGKAKDLMCGDTVSIHHYAASWHPAKVCAKRKIVNAIGAHNVQKLKKLLRK